MPRLVLCLVSFFLLAPAASRSAPKTVHPAANFSSFPNPLRGWVSWWQNHEEPQQPGTMVFAYQRWAETETAQGLYSFAAWDEKNLKFWIDRGFHVILRLELDYPRKVAQADCPQYILDHGNKGTWYDKPEIGKGYSPDYDDPFFLENLERFIAAFGKHYSALDSLAVVQYGIIGHWGEWHTWPDGSGKMPSDASVDRIVGALKRAIPNKYLQIRYHNKWSQAEPRVGFHDDCWAELTSCADGTWCTKYNLDLLGLNDRWKSAPNGGEFCNPKRFLLGSDPEFQKALAEVRNFHASFLGPQAVGGLAPGGPHQRRLDEMEKALGYRFVVEEAVFDDEIRPGQPWTIRLKIRNTGSAPFYFGWKPELSFLDSKGSVLWSAFLNQDPISWLPGQIAEWSETLSPSPALQSPPPQGGGLGRGRGDYALALSLRDPRSSRLARFANTPLDSVGRLVLGQVLCR